MALLIMMMNGIGNKQGDVHPDYPICFCTPETPGIILIAGAWHVKA